MEEIWRSGKCIDSEKGKMNSSPSSIITVLLGEHAQLLSLSYHGENESSEPDDL